jgi:predicted MarR family transcription regulator
MDAIALFRHLPMREQRNKSESIHGLMRLRCHGLPPMRGDEEIWMSKRPTSPEAEKNALDRSWHLARTALEIDVTEVEYALMRCFEAFGRWQAECLASVSDFSATGPENALLHVIRMNDRPKSMRDLAHMTNREDIPNIQYSLRKLIQGGLVVRSGSGRSGVVYEVTEEGRDVTDRYAAVRAVLLVGGVERVPELSKRMEEAARTLELMTGIYEQAARSAATHRRRPGAHLAGRTTGTGNQT